MTGEQDRIREGLRLRRLRTENAEQGSPCKRCDRVYCPSKCFTCKADKKGGE